MEVAGTHPNVPLRDEAQIRFHPFFLRSPEDAEGAWRVGVEQSALAIELPIEGVMAMQTLQAGKSLAETTTILLSEYGEAIDPGDLVQELAELGMVERIDDVQFAPPSRVGQRWLERISPGAVGWLSSRVTLTIFAVLILAGPLLLVFEPALRPRTQDLLWASCYTLDLLMLLVLGPLLLLKHELGHLLTARAKGLPAELTFGHRLFYLVAVSRIGEIWFIMLSEYVGIAWQFQIFLKTDIYHLLTELTRRHDLLEQASVCFRSWWHAAFPGLLRQPEPQDHVVLADPLMLGYTAFSAVGIGASCIWLTIYALPALFIALHGELTLLLTSIPTHHLLALLDSLVSLGLQMLWGFLLCWSMVRTWNK
jgi:hypothetical protein